MRQHPVDEPTVIGAAERDLDFDLPSVIYDLPFLKEDAKRNILGGNAARLFNLPMKPVKTIP